MGVAALGLGWLAAEVLIPWYDQRALESSLAEHAWSMASLKPGQTYELASFPVPPGQGDAPTFSVTLNTYGVRERGFSESPEADIVRVIAIGDSTTFGTGVAADQRFTALLQSALEEEPHRRYEILNCGKAGMTARAGRTFYETQVRGWNPKILIVGLGTNNLRDGNDPNRRTESKNALDSYQIEIEALAREAQKDGVHVIFWANIVLDEMGANTLAPFNDRLAKAAEKYGMPLVRLTETYAQRWATKEEQTAFLANSPWTSYWKNFGRIPIRKTALHQDMAHPNAAGFDRLARAMAPLIRQAPIQ